MTEYADPSRRARAIGIWAGAASLGLAAGPVVGGAITSVANWRAGFMLSVDLGVITVALGFRVIPRARYGQPAHPVRSDFMGAGLSTLTLAALTYGLIESATLGWSSPLIIGAFGVTAGAAAGFIATQHTAGRRGRQPLMLYGILYFYSIDLQQYTHYSTSRQG